MANSTANLVSQISMPQSKNNHKTDHKEHQYQDFTKSNQKHQILCENALGSQLRPLIGFLS